MIICPLKPLQHKQFLSSSILYIGGYMLAIILEELKCNMN
jgi:hypothetical protein